jgi:hypothetical protein
MGLDDGTQFGYPEPCGGPLTGLTAQFVAALKGFVPVAHFTLKRCHGAL